MSSHLLKLATRSYSLSHLRGSSPGAPRKVDGLLHCCNEGVTTAGLASCSVGIFVLFLLFSFNSPNSGDNPLNRRLLRRLSLLSTFDVSVPGASTKLVTEFEKVHSSIKQTIRFILTLGARYNTGLRTCPTGDELCFYTLRNIREITSMHSKE
ncbi:hypothetical protein TNCV_4466001 [Trichonephila clavipes]|nr:hypothetical protein TNCV_4466001 [Trichonephila clavipes]